MRAVPLFVVVAAAAALAAACAPTNPYDPQTPSTQQEPAKVHGTVSDSRGPVAGAAVSIGDAKTTTDKNGLYTLTGLVPGIVTLDVSQPAHQEFARDLVLLAGEDRRLDVTLVSLSGDAGGHIQGTALKGSEAGAAHPDHSGIIVEIETAGARTVTDAAGKYDLVIAPGTYDLTMSARDNIAQTVAGVVVTAGQTTLVDPVTLAANPGSASGTVTLEPLVPGSDVHGGVVVSAGAVTATTGSDDSFSLTGLAPGTRVLRFTKDGYEQAERTVEVVAGDDTAVDPVRLALARGAVTGFVSLNGLADASGVTVTLRGAAGAFSSVSASDGSFFVAALPGGTYDVQATRAGFVPAAGGSLDVVADTTTPLNDAAHPLVLAAQAGDFLIDDGASFTNDPVVTLSIDATGAPPVQMELSEDASFSGASPVAFDEHPTFTLSGDGAHTIFLLLFDDAGNPSGPFQASIVLDTAPPADASIGVDDGAPFSNNQDGFVALTPFATDTGSGVAEMQIALDGDAGASFVPFTTALVFPIAGNADGVHTFTAVFRDRAGNESAPVTSSITLDRTPPAVSRVFISADGTSSESAFAHSPIVQVFVEPDAGTTDVVAMALSTDPLFPSTVFQPFASPSSFLLAPGDGTRTVSVKLEDAAGNVSSVASDSIDVDTSAPSAASVLLAGGAAVTNQQVVDIDLAAVGATKVRASLTGNFAADGSDFVGVASFPGTIDLGAGDGTKTVFAQFADDAGNVSDVVSDSVVVDTTAPVLGPTPVLVNAGDAFTRSVSVNVAFDVAGASSVAVAVDGAVDTEPFQPFSAFLTVLLPSLECTAGALDCRTVCAVFADDAGNRSAQVCDGITLDVTAPSAPLLAEKGGVVSSADVTLHFVDVSPDTFFDHFEVLVDPGSPSFQRVTPGAPSGGLRPLALTLTAPSSNDPLTAAQPNVVRVRAVDKAGNVSPETAVTIVVDDVKPSAPVLAAQPPATNQTPITLSFDPTNSADEDATFDHYAIVTTSAVGTSSFTSFQRDGILVSLDENVTNTVRVVAVDAAGNVSLPATFTIAHDDVPPAAPLVSPDEGTVRATSVEISLATPSLDPPPADAAPGARPTPVTRYQVKDGTGQGFVDAADAVGPFPADIARNSDNEVCLRGVDDAGNVSIETCALVHERTQTALGTATDHPHGADVYGDFVVFAGKSAAGVNGMFLRDTFGGFADVELTNGHGELGANGDIHLDGDGDHLFGVWENSANGGANVIVDMDFAAAAPDGTPAITAGTFLGSSPDVDDDTIVYFDQGAVRERPTTVPPDFDAGTFNIDPDPNDHGVDISGPVTLCPGTVPRAGGGVAVWCQVSNSITQLVRHILADGGDTSRNVVLAQNLDVVREGTLVGSGQSLIQQPVVSDAMIAWSSADPGLGAGVFFVDISGDPAATTPVAAGGLVVDAMQDADGFTLSSVQARGFSNDAALFELGANPISLGGTDDASPQDDTSADGGRLFFEDISQGEHLALVDSSSTRWISPVGDLAFQAATSTDLTVWIAPVQGAGGSTRVGLVGRRVPVDGQPLVVVDSAVRPVAFFGPSHGDPPYGVGGTRVAYASGASPPFKLFVVDMATGDVALASNNAGLAVAVDPDGDDLAFVDAAGNVEEVALPATLPATLSPATVSLAGTGTPVLLDVDDGMIIAQRGGDPERETSPTDAGAVVCAQGGVSGVVPVGNAHAPKVAHLDDGRFLLAASAGATTTMKACFLTCGATPVCAGLGGAGAGQDTHVQATREGKVVFLNDAGGFDQVESFDAFTLARHHLTTDGFDRDAPGAAAGRVVFSDPSLSGGAVFEVTSR